LDEVKEFMVSLAAKTNVSDLEKELEAAKEEVGASG
jgi:hypothetical protein